MGVRVREGAPIGKSLGAARVFPPMMMHLISSGESSGELDTMLDRAAMHQPRQCPLHTHICILIIAITVRGNCAAGRDHGP